VRKDRRRFGKYVTVVEGFDGMDVKKIAKELKQKIACGGTAKDGKVELQGDHTSRVADVLSGMGFSVDMNV